MPAVEPDASRCFAVVSETLVSLVHSRAYIPEEATLFEAVAMLQTENISSLPVLRGGRLIGQLRATRLLECCLAGSQTAGSQAYPFIEGETRVFAPTAAPSEVWAILCAGELPFLGDPLLVVDDTGQYLGYVRVEDLGRHIHERGRAYARYTNPLTGLPGSVPVNVRIDELLRGGRMFVVACCDVEGIRAYNDAYGYARGDEVIRFVADVITRCIDPELDFVGHVGGDDFMVIFQSPDWFERCERMARLCDLGAPDFYPPDEREGGGIYLLDRAQRRAFCPFFALSIGVVSVEPGRFQGHHEIAAAGIEARQRAKLARGGAICIDEHMPPPADGRAGAKLYN